ncbi:asparaginase [Thalassoporum mexicanum PCC 7367]|uniref:asparaginase n=1 Tax=Thalassoporum mexicanum TaxID=3457544 RepID=UPI00029F8A5A|nr:asparaginase [Pseudanabaena sp. PCC 7367]AFY69096.1 asparaginase [Pseudanabaena sp. PCC 7367]
MNLGRSRRPAVVSPPISVNLLREGIVESTHICKVAIADARGRILSAAGDPATATFGRSALKPIQAIAVSATGVIERFNLSEADLAIICGSHQGSIGHARQVFNILWRCDVESTTLTCPVPSNATSPLQHNCSGKHAGMIAVCQHHNWSPTGYANRKHPVQTLILNKMAELLHIPAAELICAHDDCGVPTYLLEIGQMANLFAQLSSRENLHLERISRAMVSAPEMVAGVGEFDTELMRLSQGTIVSKSGAEGVQCIGRMGEGLGISIKVMDGAKRAKHAAAIHILRQLGWISPSVAESLAEMFMTFGNYKRLEVNGELSMA